MNEALSDVTEARTDWLFLLLFFPDLDTVLRPVIGDANLGDAPLGDVLLGDALELASPSTSKESRVFLSLSVGYPSRSSSSST